RVEVQEPREESRELPVLRRIVLHVGLQLPAEACEHSLGGEVGIDRDAVVPEREITAVPAPLEAEKRGTVGAPLEQRQIDREPHGYLPRAGNRTEAFARRPLTNWGGTIREMTPRAVAPVCSPENRRGPARNRARYRRFSGGGR